MSLNSLQDDMSRRAASMASMAQRTNNPQQIQSLQQRLIADIQSGAIKPYVGIPLVQELSKKLSEAKAKMAQGVATAGMPPPTQGGVPIAQQIMAQAAQEGQGVPSLESNLPQSYTGGGIIAFEDGGQVERYQNKGYTGNPMGMGGNEIMSAAGTGDPYVGRNFLEGVLSVPEDPEWKRKLKVEQAIRERDAAMGVTPPATPAATPYDPTTATRRYMFSGQAQPPAPAAPAIPGIGGFNFKMPTLGGMKETAAPTLMDYGTITKDLPKNMQDASEKAVKATQEKLEEFDKPLDAKGARLESRDAQLAKDSEISRWMALLKGGARTLAGTSRFAGENFGKGLETGIDELVRGEAANRAAKDKLESAKDNLDDQRIAAKKGNYQAAQAAGNRAADDERQATQMTMTGAHYGNTEALNRYQTQQQGEFQKASLDQSGKLGIAGLGLQAQQIAQHGAIAQAQLAAQEKRFNAMDEASRARIMQATAKGLSDFMQNEGAQLKAQLAKDYGPNFMTAQDARSLEAKRTFIQQRDAYLAVIKGQAIDALSARPSGEF